jgi:endonuclease-8
MPEGDTIFRAARTLHRALAGGTVTAAESAYAALARLEDEATIVGRTMERVEARGKWLLMFFSGDLILASHMRMRGSWHLYRAGERWQRPRSQMRLLLSTADWQAVAFLVPVIRVHSAHTLRRDAAISGLGPDLLGENFPEAQALAAMEAGPGVQVGDMLLDQRVMAGLGNVYKSEVAFRCGIDPFRRVGSLSLLEKKNLIAEARHLLAQNVREAMPAGAASPPAARRTTSSPDPAVRLWVYRRQGRPCRRCGALILRHRQGAGARSTYWCPCCQPGPGSGAGPVSSPGAGPARASKS